MAKITIGGRDEEGDLSTFDKLEDSWPFIKEAERIGRAIKALPEGAAPEPGSDQMAQMRAMIQVVAVCIGKPFEEVRKTIKRDEIPALAPFFIEVTRETKKSGEGEPEA